MAIEFDDRALDIIGNNVKALRFFDDDRQLQAEIFLDENNVLNVGNFSVSGGNGAGGSNLDLADVGLLSIAPTDLLDQERVFVAGDGLSADDQGGGNNYTVSVKESEIDHDALQNFVPDEHVAHSGVSISAGNGLTGGGDISASRTINLDTPGTLAHDSSNSATGSHTHAITASSNPGSAASLLKSTASGGLTLELLNVDNVRLDGGKVEATAGDLTLDAAGGDVVLPSAVNIGTDHFVSELTGWRIDYDGSADFRDIFADELRVRAFIADIEQALAGGQIVSKSVALLSRDFEVPVGGRDIIAANTTSDFFAISGDHTDAIDVGQGFDVSGSTGNDGSYTVASVSLNASDNTQINVNEDITDGTADGEVRFKETIFVEDLPGFADTQVFVANDWLRLRVIDRSGGGLVVADVWGRVGTYSDLAGGEQSWTFVCRDDGDVDGDTVHAGALALDYGASGDGYWEVTALGNDVPYSQIVTWATDPSVSGNHTMRTRVGNLDGVTDSNFTNLGGWGIYSNNAFLTGRLRVTGGDVRVNEDGVNFSTATGQNDIGITWTNARNVGLNYYGAPNEFLELFNGTSSDPESLGAQLKLSSVVENNDPITTSASILLKPQITGVSDDEITTVLEIRSGGAVDIYLGEDTGKGSLPVDNSLTILDGDLVVDDGPIVARGDLRIRTSGNNEVLGVDVSEGEVDITGDATISGDLAVNTDTLFVDASTDRVGVGTASPVLTLDVQSGEVAGGYMSRFFNTDGADTSNVMLVRGGANSNTTATFFSLRDGDNTEIGRVEGDGAGGTEYNTSSDERIKDDITPLPPGALTRVLALEPVRYRGKGAPPERGKRTGLIAQQVQEHVPDVVSEGEDGLLGIAYGRLVPELIGAIQELEAEVATLRAARGGA